jgi:hypothetical protein
MIDFINETLLWCIIAMESFFWCLTIAKFYSYAKKHTFEPKPQKPVRIPARPKSSRKTSGFCGKQSKHTDSGFIKPKIAKDFQMTVKGHNKEVLKELERVRKLCLKEREEHD